MQVFWLPDHPGRTVFPVDMSSVGLLCDVLFCCASRGFWAVKISKVDILIGSDESVYRFELIFRQNGNAIAIPQKGVILGAGPEGRSCLRPYRRDCPDLSNAVL